MRALVSLPALLAPAVTCCTVFASAQTVSWCANFDDGTTECDFYTQQECFEAVSGVGGQCFQNLGGWGVRQSWPTTSSQGSGWAPAQVGPPPGLDGAPADPGGASR
jgi:hypothetical protein